MTRTTFLEPTDEASQPGSLRWVKIAVVAPFLVCGFAFLLVAAVVLSPLIPLVEIWRVCCCRNGGNLS